MIHKPLPRLVEKKQKRQAKMAAKSAFIDDVWVRDKHHCRACGHYVVRGGTDALRRGHVHHLRFRSLGGGGYSANGALLCATCHALVHAYRLTIQGNGNGTLTFSAEGRKPWKSAVS